jgi:hypothetical protein
MDGTPFRCVIIEEPQHSVFLTLYISPLFFALFHFKYFILYRPKFSQWSDERYSRRRHTKSFHIDRAGGVEYVFKPLIFRNRGRRHCTPQRAWMPRLTKRERYGTFPCLLPPPQSASDISRSLSGVSESNSLAQSYVVEGLLSSSHSRFRQFCL